MSAIYLDHNATTPTLPEVVEEMRPFFTKAHGNPSSLHAPGRQAAAAVDRARRRVAGLIGADFGEIVFTSGGTEANNAAILGMTLLNSQAPRTVVTSAVEHPSIAACCDLLKEMGYRIVRLPVDRNGTIDLHAAREEISTDTALVSVGLANNQVGTVQPLAELAAIAAHKGVPLHSDAVQAVGRIHVDVRRIGVDLLSISAHKMGGPKGCGALFVRSGVRLRGLLRGGPQEKRRRAGTENVPGIVGLGAACNLASDNLQARAAHTEALLRKLERGIARRIPSAVFNGDVRHRLPNTLNVSFPPLEGDALLMNLDLRGIAVSTGAACSAAAAGPSHVLRAMGRPPDEAFAALRFSLAPSNTEAEIDRTLDVLQETVERLRENSPVVVSSSNRGS